MVTDLAKASSLSKRMLIRGARKLVASRLTCEQEEKSLLSNLQVYLKLNGSGSATRLAIECGVTPATVSEIANGKRSCSTKVAGKIAELW